MNPTRSYNDHEYDRWTNRSVDPNNIILNIYIMIMIGYYYVLHIIIICIIIL